MGMCAFWCNDELSKTWPSCFRLPSIQVDRNPDELNGTIKFCNQSIDITLSRELAKECDFRTGYCFANVTRTQANYYIESILLASGFKTPGTDACLYLFHCSKEIAENWPNLLQDKEKDSIKLIDTDLIGHLESFHAKIVHRKSAKLIVYSGPAYDPLNKKDLYFICIGPGHWRKTSLNDSLLADSIVNAIYDSSISQVHFGATFPILAK